MENSTITRLNNVHEHVVTQLHSEKKRADDIRSIVAEYSQQIEFIVKHGSDNHLFAFLKSMSGIILDTNKSFQDFVSSLREMTLNCTQLDVLKGEDLGVIEVLDTETNKSFHPNQKTQAPMIPNRIRRVTSFTRSQTTVTKSQPNSFTKIDTLKGIPGITGIIPNNDHAVLCGNKAIYTFIPKGKCLPIMKFETDVWGISRHFNTQLLAITNQKGLVHIIQNSQIERTINVPRSKSYGITWINDKLYVGGKGEVHILDNKFVHERTFTVQGASIIYYMHYSDQRLYLSDYMNSAVYCVDVNGAHIFTYGSPELNIPEGITSDSAGKIYVAGRNSNNIHRMSLDGKSSEVILTQRDGIHNPGALTFSSDYQKLFIYNTDGDSILVFDVKY